jgi:hypothetical protein
VILLVEHRHQQPEQAQALFGVVRLPHADFEIRETGGIELAHRSGAARRRQHERQRKRRNDAARDEENGPKPAH